MSIEFQIVFGITYFNQMRTAQYMTDKVAAAQILLLQILNLFQNSRKWKDKKKETNKKTG